ncbi:MAG: 50S ribosomal protein L6 [Deltaproteobacteria bacterium]|nr:50S ribosomal protein L6 [Deltaproteobacteria bacterium]
MSRIGKKPIPIPSGVDVKTRGDQVTVKGPLGTLSRDMLGVKLAVDGGKVVVKPDEAHPKAGSLHGLMRTLVANMVQGVSAGFMKVLNITGTGYKAEMGTGVVVLNLGFSHPINFKLPKDVTAEVTNKNLTITLKSVNKESLGDTAAKIRALRPIEPYKGKGIAYSTERIKRKVGKAGTK